MVLHGVQDFYAHSNWADVDWKGKGFREDAIYEEVPRRLAVLVRDERGRTLHTGFWSLTGRSPEGLDRHEELNKDHAKRPHHKEAYAMAARATARWVERFKKRLAGSPGASFEILAAFHDDSLEHLATEALRGAERLSKAVGSWDGSKPDKEPPTATELREVLLPTPRRAHEGMGSRHARYSTGLTGKKDEGRDLKSILGDLEKPIAKALEGATRIFGAGLGEIGKSVAR